MKEMIRVEFDGYWLERYQAEIPQRAGIYCVYACESVAKDKIVVLRELLYIGESDDVREAIAGAEDAAVWKERLHEGEELCYSVASVEREVRGIAWEAMVSHHRPPCNRMIHKRAADISLTIVGEHELLDDFIAGVNEQTMLDD